MNATTLGEDSSGFRRFHVEAITENRGRELDLTYGTGGGVGSALEAFRYVGAGDADVSMRGADVEGTRAGQLEPRADHIVFWIADGTAEVTDLEAGIVTSARPGHPIVLSASVRYGFTADTRKVTLLHLSERVLRRALAMREQPVDGPLVFEQQPDIESALGPLRAILRNRAGALTDEQLDGARRAALNAAIAEAVLDAFPLRAPTATGASTIAVRAAEWIREHARGEVTLQDIAAAVGLSERGLQSAFRRQFDETPMGRLRAERLEGARRDLHGAPAGTQVSDVARRWRFGHFGRFAANYADRFGETPSETLRRTRQHDS